MSDGDGERDAFDAVVAAVRAEVDPDADERAALEAVVERVVARAEDAVADLPVDADVLQVGSTARGTWIAGDRDVDVFVRFPPDLPREDLQRYGLEVGKAVLPEGREEYAEHPYVKGDFEGYTVDLVPCYRVESATDIASSVDRTPFHTEYLRERLTPDLAGEVRAFKQFLKGVGAYGSDLRTRGFSGYLTELLVLEYGGFRETLEAAADWHPPVKLDPDDHGQARETAEPSRNDEAGRAGLAFDDPLIVIDPTDPERNVAAVVSESNVARLQHYARAVLDDPREDCFWPDDPDPLSRDEVAAHLDRRDTRPLAVRFDAPDLVEDQLYPQLRRSRDGLVRGLEDAGFAVLRAEAWADETAVLFAELSVADLPAVERHEGPPVHVEGHARGFYEKYADTDAYGPFVEDGRYVVERERAVTSAEAFARDRIFDVALGAHVETALEDGYEVLAGDAVADLADEFGEALARYFDPRP
jgi:tRNA nucleotidyltransferase (CCA-adding enzyme)